MATQDKDKSPQSAADAKAAEAAKPAKAATSAKPTEAPKSTAAKEPRVSTCVVDDGRGMHVGDAVNGKVCSYHAMHYDAQGNRR